MFTRTATVAAGLISLLLVVRSLSADEPLFPEEPKAESAESPGAAEAKNSFGVNDVAQAAADLRKAGEAFERCADSLSQTAESIAASLATMSSEFDPFGYKTAFRTLGEQSEMLRQQREIIQALQEREIHRLRRENQALKKEVQKLRKSQAASHGNSQ